jgi:DNA-binding IclR family transcriptional regulator
VFLAYLPETDRSVRLGLPLATFTGKTVTDCQALEEELVAVKHQGYAIVHEEYEEGFSSIAAPIFNYENQVIATITVSGPTYRMGSDKAETFVEIIQEVSNSISTEMGFVNQNKGLLKVRASHGN